MKLWRLRTKTSGGTGVLAVLLLALSVVLGGMAMAQLEKIDLGAQQLSTQLLPRAVPASSVRTELNRLRQLETELVGARSLAQAQLGTEQLAEQLQRFKALEERFANLLESSEERMRFAAYSTSRDSYLQWQQHIVEMALALDFRSAESLALTSAALVQVYASDSQNSFAAAATALDQWQQDNAAAAQQAGALARQLAANTRGWMLWALAGAALLSLALTLGLLLLLARNRSAGQNRASPYRSNAGRRQGDRDAMHPHSDWRNTRTPLQPQGFQQSDWLNRRAKTNAPDVLDSPASPASPASVTSPAALAPNSQIRKTRVTAEDWDSF